jgi:RNA polymerase sigma factor (sigma-70 family)
MQESELSDEFLIGAVADGAIWAFERLYDRYCERFYRLAYRMTADHMVAEELVQDVFLAIWQSAASYDPQVGPAQSWLFSLIHHRAVDHVRRAHYYATLQPAQWPESTMDGHQSIATRDGWEQVWHAMQNVELHACLGQLPVEQRMAIELAYFAGWTHQEIAQRCQIPLGTIKARIRLGILHLRHILEQKGEGRRLPAGTINHREGQPGQITTIATVAEERCAAGYALGQDSTWRCFGYTEWEQVIEQIAAFEFCGVMGSFIARKERRRHGRTYWYAYTWGDGGRRKVYLGKPADLTLAHMEAIARQLRHEPQG